MPILPVLRGSDPFTGTNAERAVRQAGTEVLFAAEDEALASEKYIDAIHRRGQLLWVNAIVYNRTDILSAGHTDDRAVAGDYDGGWGWLVDRGFDIIQTDFTAQLKQYLTRRQIP
jgi:glycerophosphoryl diester phosphodiesterase